MRPALPVSPGYRNGKTKVSPLFAIWSGPGKVPLYVQTTDGIIPVPANFVNRVKIGVFPQLIAMTGFSINAY
jgi:hypothetical protein